MDSLRKEWRYRNPNDDAERRKKLRQQLASVMEDMLDEVDKTSQSTEEKIREIVSQSAMMCLLSIDNEEFGSSFDVVDPKTVADEKTDYLYVISEEVEQLEDQEKQIVHLFYTKGFKQKEIAESLGMSRSTLCRLHSKILVKLKNRLALKLKDIQ